MSFEGSNQNQVNPGEPLNGDSIEYDRLQTALIAQHLNRSTNRNFHDCFMDKDSIINNCEKRFRIEVDVQKFLPREIDVRVEGNYIILKLEHDDRPEEFGSVNRCYIHKYFVPDMYNLNALYTTLSADGILTFIAPSFQQDARI